MKKYMADWVVTENLRLHSNYCLIKLTHSQPLPEMFPGQFVQVWVDHSSATFLRRPISVHYVEKSKNELWLLIQLVGDGTRKLAELQGGDIVNLLYPLGNHFSLPEKNMKLEKPEKKFLLIGGGIGVAPLFFLGSCLKELGYSPSFLLGARSSDDLLQLEFFEQFGTVYTTTEDGSFGEKGLVTHHSILQNEVFDMIYTCGPKPMMQAVAAFAKKRGTQCEVSLENMMACGIGACLCCVENTIEGHVCVCTQGPVANIEKLTWHI